MNNFKQEQLSELGRHMNRIRAFRILEIREDELVINVPGKTYSTAAIPVTDISDYQVGGYIDCVFNGIYNNGVMSSYQIRFFGETPNKFIPKDGALIGDF